MDAKRLVVYLAAILVIGPLAFVVVSHQAAPVTSTNGPSVYWSNSFGGGDLQVFANVCAGKVRLTQGAATVKDLCFTGDTNIVICSDITSVNPVRCEPGRGALIVEGQCERRHRVRSCEVTTKDGLTVSGMRRDTYAGRSRNNQVRSMFRIYRTSRSRGSATMT